MLFINILIKCYYKCRTFFLIFVLYIFYFNFVLTKGLFILLAFQKKQSIEHCYLSLSVFVPYFIKLGSLLFHSSGLLWLETQAREGRAFCPRWTQVSVMREASRKLTGQCGKPLILVDLRIC